MGNIKSGPLPSRNWKWPNISTTEGILTPNYIHSCFFMSWRIKWYICHELRGCYCPPHPRNCKWPNIFKMIEITTRNHLCSCCARGIRWYVGHEPWGDPDPLEPVVPKYFESYLHPITIILVSCVKGYQRICR